MKIKVCIFNHCKQKTEQFLQNLFADTPDNSDNEMNTNNVNSSDDQWEEDDSDEENDDEKLNGKMDVSNDSN